jgi:hypothetical protein
MERQLQTHEPSLIDAVLRVIEAGQKLVLDRVDLARLDVARLASYALRGAVLVAVGAVLIAGAWFATLGFIVLALESYLSPTTSLLVIAVATFVAGAASISTGIRRARSWALGSTEAASEGELS